MVQHINYYFLKRFFSLLSLSFVLLCTPVVGFTQGSWSTVNTAGAVNTPATTQQIQRVTPTPPHANVAPPPKRISAQESVEPTKVNRRKTSR